MLWAALLFATPAPGEPAKVPVDVELVLLVDVSPSMNGPERRLQRDAYVSAFRHRTLLRAVDFGARGAIAVAFVEWGGLEEQTLVMPWTVVDDGDDALRFAQDLARQPGQSGTGTSISAALAFAGGLFAQSPAEGLRRVIDISGDGPNNTGPEVAPVRDALVADGIIINGLPIAMRNRGSDGYEFFDRAFLERYFLNCVVGGDSAFLISVEDRANLERSVLLKLVREISAGPAPAERLERAADVRETRAAVNCEGAGQGPGF